MAKALCVDIGATRIKWAFIRHERGTVTDWSQPAVRTMRSLGWMNETLPTLFDPDVWPGITARDLSEMRDVDDLCIAVCSPVENGSVGGQLAGMNVPNPLQQCIQRFWPGRYVKLINDAEACFFGFRRYSDRFGLKAQAPLLILTLGTGVGVVAARDWNSIVASEFYGFRTSNLGAACGRGTAGIDVHQALGKAFFEWAGSHNRAWPYLHVRDEYTRRVAALVTDCVHAWGPLRTVVVAGGNAEYVSLRRLEALLGGRTRVVGLRQPEISIEPDLIHLAGAL